jgi:hypothetical protein
LGTVSGFNQAGFQSGAFGVGTLGRSGIEMDQRLTIVKLCNVLQRDPYYGQRDADGVPYVAQELFDKMKAERLRPPLTFDFSRQLVGVACATDPIFMMIFAWCGLGRLNTYHKGESKPTGWFGQEFADRCDLDLEIDRDEFERFLRRRKLPLPPAWFPEKGMGVPGKRARKRRYSEQEEKARKLAEEAWKEASTRTTAWIIENRLKKDVRKPEEGALRGPILRPKGCSKNAGKPFDDDTYREWIQQGNPRFKGKKTTPQE